MDGDQIVRVNYLDRQFLRPQDFQDEQAYHLVLHRRHQVGRHGWGIVGGLDIVVDPQDGEPYLQPGMAIDGYGRDLVQGERVRLPTSAFDSRQSEILDVYLAYDRVPG